MTIFGITGQSGAGKTTVLQVLEEMKGYVIDCDAIYWELLATDLLLKQALVTEFGDITHETGEIDRKKLGSLVFSDQQRLLRLNEITHPFVLDKVEEKIKEAQENASLFVAIDGISLIESGLNTRCDFVFAVIAEESKRVTRIMQRDQITEEYAISRVKAQKNDVFYEENSNVVIKNDFEHVELFSQYVKDFFIKYVS